MVEFLKDWPTVQVDDEKWIEDISLPYSRRTSLLIIIKHTTRMRGFANVSSFRSVIKLYIHGAARCWGQYSKGLHSAHNATIPAVPAGHHQLIVPLYGHLSILKQQWYLHSLMFLSSDKQLFNYTFLMFKNYLTD